MTNDEAIDMLKTLVGEVCHPCARGTLIYTDGQHRTVHGQHVLCPAEPIHKRIAALSAAPDAAPAAAPSAVTAKIDWFGDDD